MPGVRIHLGALLIAATLCGVAGAVDPEPTAPSTLPTTAPASQPAAIVVLSGQVDDFTRDSLFKHFKAAREAGAKVVILQINTYGGLVTSGLDISRFLKRQDDLHVIAFVNEKAISAGAMIALAADEIVMEPAALLGDSAPIAIAPGGNSATTMGDTERAKAESPILEDFRASALRNGYDPLLAEAMVAIGRTVHWVESEASGERRFVDAEEFKRLTELKDETWKPVSGVRNPIDRADSLLTVETDLAVKLGLASGVAVSPDALAATRGYTIAARLQPSGGERFVGWLASPMLRFILLLIFMQSAYIALHSPGTGAAEVIAVVAIVLLVGMPWLTGYAQWWEILAIVIGLVLLAVELFIVPGFGVLGIAGIILTLFGLIMTFVGIEPGNVPGMPDIVPTLRGTWSALQQGLLVVVGGLVCSLFLWFWLNRYLPKLPYFNRLILSTTTGAAVATDAAAPTQGTWPVVGAIGRAVTDLRPGGTAEFRDESIGDTRVADVVSESGFVTKNTKIVVREVHGNHVVVRVM